MKFVASNYAMGRAVKTIKIEAASFAAACREAERLMPSANGLPGTSRQAASKSRVIGVRHA